jgi:hypothetical protein
MLPAHDGDRIGKLDDGCVRGSLRGERVGDRHVARTSSTCSVRSRQLPHRELNLTVGELPPVFIKAVPYKIHTVLTDNGIHFTDPSGESWRVTDIKGHD